MIVRSSAVVAESGFVGFKSALVAGLEEVVLGFFEAFGAISSSGARSASVLEYLLSLAQESSGVQDSLIDFGGSSWAGGKGEAPAAAGVELLGAAEK